MTPREFILGPPPDKSNVPLNVYISTFGIIKYNLKEILLKDVFS